MLDGARRQGLRFLRLADILAAEPEPFKGYSPDDPRSYEFLTDAPSSQTDGTKAAGISWGTLAVGILGGAAVAGLLVYVAFTLADDGKKRKRK